jgi:two-component system sensor histidine kinase DesK
VAGFAAIAVIFVLQLFNSSFAAPRWPPWRRWTMLSAQAVVTYLPLLILGMEWGSMAGFLAGSVLLLLGGWLAWALFAAITASMVIVPLETELTAGLVAYLALATMNIGLVVFGLSRLSQAVRYAYAARAERAQLAIAKERVRFARDLHDLLGYSLSAITLKAELARRLVTTDPGRSRDEIAELLDIARQALADVRTVSSGYRNISLNKETAAVTSLLTGTGIETRVEMNCGALEERVDTVLATVLRESVTNMLRHSAARTCLIEANQAGGVVRLHMVNDGVPPSVIPHRDGGGLESLSARLAAIGGTLTATIRNGQFDLLAQVPARPVEAVAGSAASNTMRGESA